LILLHLLAGLEKVGVEVEDVIELVRVGIISVRSSAVDLMSNAYVDGVVSMG
jgi:hypothetical protein